MNFKYSTESTPLVLGAVGLCPAYGGVLYTPDTPACLAQLWPRVCAAACRRFERHMRVCRGVRGRASWARRPFLLRLLGAEDENCPTFWHKAGSSTGHSGYIYTGWLWPKEEDKAKAGRCIIKDQLRKRENNGNFWGKSIEKEFLIAKLLWKIKQELWVNNRL